MMPAKTQHIPPMSSAPDGFSIERELPSRFGAFYKPLHDVLTPRQQQIIGNRKAVLKASLDGKRPSIFGDGSKTRDSRIEKFLALIASTEVNPKCTLVSKCMTHAFPRIGAVLCALESKHSF